MTDERSDAAKTYIQCWKVRPKGESYWLYLAPEHLKDLPDHLAGSEPGESYELEMFLATREEIEQWKEFRRMVTSRCKHDLLVADCGTCGPDRLRDAKTTRPKHGETYPDGPGEESRLRAENERLREALREMVEQRDRWKRDYMKLLSDTEGT